MSLGPASPGYNVALPLATTKTNEVILQNSIGLMDLTLKSIGYLHVFSCLLCWHDNKRTDVGMPGSME